MVCMNRSWSFLPWSNKNNMVVNFFSVVQYMYDGITFHTTLTVLRLFKVMSLREWQFLLGSSNKSKRIELNMAGTCVITSTKYASLSSVSEKEVNLFTIIVIIIVTHHHHHRHHCRRFPYHHCHCYHFC